MHMERTRDEYILHPDVAGLKLAMLLCTCEVKGMSKFLSFFLHFLSEFLQQCYWEVHQCVELVQRSV